MYVLRCDYENDKKKSPGFKDGERLDQFQNKLFFPGHVRATAVLQRPRHHCLY